LLSQVVVAAAVVGRHEKSEAQTGRWPGRLAAAAWPPLPWTERSAGASAAPPQKSWLWPQSPAVVVVAAVVRIVVVAVVPQLCFVSAVAVVVVVAAKNVSYATSWG